MISLGEPYLKLINEVNSVDEVTTNSIVLYRKFTVDNVNWTNKTFVIDGKSKTYWTLPFENTYTNLDTFNADGRLIETYILKEDDTIYVCFENKMSCTVRMLKNNADLSNQILYKHDINLHISYVSDYSDWVVNITTMDGKTVVMKCDRIIFFAHFNFTNKDSYPCNKFEDLHRYLEKSINYKCSGYLLFGAYSNNYFNQTVIVRLVDSICISDDKLLLNTIGSDTIMHDPDLYKLGIFEAKDYIHEIKGNDLRDVTVADIVTYVR